MNHSKKMIEQRYVVGEYLKINPAWHSEDSLWKARQILRGIKESNLEPKTVCEIGCGAGEILYHLHKALPDDVLFTGYEISPQAYQFCQNLREPRLSFHNEDFFALSRQSFDLLLAMDVLEHLPDYMAALAYLKNKATYKIFHIPLELTAFNSIGKGPLLNSRKKLGHLHFFNRELALAALEESGYFIMTEFYTHWEEELPHRMPKNPLEKAIKFLIKRYDTHAAVRLLGGYSLLVVAK